MTGIWIAHHDAVGAAVLRFCTGDLAVRLTHGTPTVVAEAAGRGTEITVARLRTVAEANEVVLRARMARRSGEARVLDIAAIEDSIRAAPVCGDARGEAAA